MLQVQEQRVQVQQGLAQALVRVPEQQALGQPVLLEALALAARLTRDKQQQTLDKTLASSPTK